jgi:hypothetical protein
MILMLIGAIAALSFLVALYFVKFWLRTNDRFFLFFALSFFALGCNRVLYGILRTFEDDDLLVFSIRLLSYLFIAIAIIDKNLGRREKAA